MSRKMQNMKIWEIFSCRMWRTCNYWWMHKSWNRLTKTQIKWTFLKKKKQTQNQVSEKAMRCRICWIFNSFGLESTNMPRILQISQDFFFRLCRELQKFRVLQNLVKLTAEFASFWHGNFQGLCISSKKCTPYYNH